MASRIRLAAVLSSLAAVLLIAGCASSPGTDGPTSSPSTEPSASGSGEDSSDFEGVLLDDGRMFAVVTYGSSCVPQVEEVAADGQTVTAHLVDAGGTDQVCTADFAPRASLGALPEGVDPTKDITLEVTYGEVSDDIDLDGDAGLTGIPGTSTEYAPTAGWVDDGVLVLLTWGSPGCPPVVESAEGKGTAGTVTFVTDQDRVCTMVMGPRATIVNFDEDAVDDDAFTLTLVGDGLDGTVQVRG